MRSSATQRNSPTPTETVTISTVLSIAGTFVASTCRSGSEIVIRKPSTKPSGSMSQTRFVCVMLAPTRSPIGDIASSAPRLKSIMPTISNTAPMRNAIRMLVGIGATVKHSSSTMPMIGSTAFSDSFNFSCSFVFSNPHPPSTQSPILLLY